jgi:hypothetical protein
MELEIATNDQDGGMVNFYDFKLPTSLKDNGQVFQGQSTHFKTNERKGRGRV